MNIKLENYEKNRNTIDKSEEAEKWINKQIKEDREYKTRKW